MRFQVARFRAFVVALVGIATLVATVTTANASPSPAPTVGNGSTPSHGRYSAQPGANARSDKPRITSRTVTLQTPTFPASRTKRLVIHNTATGKTSAVAAALTPPPRCKGPSGNLSMTWYFDNGVLTTTDADMTSDTSCQPTSSSQTMDSMYDNAYLYRDSKKVHTAAYPKACSGGSATHHCLSATSDDLWACTGQACSGYYQMQVIGQMTLPANWVFSRPLAAGCTEINNYRTIICQVFTSPNIYVPPTG